MSIKPVVPFPNPALRDPTHNLEGPVTEAVRKFCWDLADTMEAATGAGLAAPQIGSPLRIFVISNRVAKDLKGHVYFINPVIDSRSEKTQSMTEGCLSFPGIFVDVIRPESVTITFTTIEGERMTRTMYGYYAQAIQHEYDHLEGKLLIDHAKPVRRGIIRRKTKGYMNKYLDYRGCSPKLKDTESTEA